MATNNFKLFDENKANMMSDTEYGVNPQRLNGVQTGVASSELNNKFAYQMSLIAYSIAQMMNANGIDANDTQAVSAFVNGLSSTVMQKVLDKATEEMSIEGIDNSHYMTPALVKKSAETVMQSGSYGNFAAKGYTLHSHIDSLIFSDVKYNEANSLVIFENFDKFVFEQKPNMIDFAISIGKIKSTVKQQVDSFKAVDLSFAISNNVSSSFAQIGQQKLAFNYNLPVGTSLEYSNLAYFMNNFSDEYTLSSSFNLERKKAFLTTASVYPKVCGGLVVRDGYSTALAFHCNGGPKEGNVSVLIEDISFWYR